MMTYAYTAAIAFCGTYLVLTVAQIFREAMYAQPGGF